MDLVYLAANLKLYRHWQFTMTRLIYNITSNLVIIIKYYTS